MRKMPGEIAKTMCDAGFDAVPMETDLSSRESIRQTIAAAEQYGSIQMLVNAAGVGSNGTIADLAEINDRLQPEMVRLNCEALLEMKRCGHILQRAVSA